MPNASLDFGQIPVDDTFVAALPADPVAGNRPRQVKAAAYSLVAPTPVRSPQLLAWSDEVGALLGIRTPERGDAQVAAVLGGSALLPGMKPYAARYGGHQFGHWAGQLGDGRAITLGERLTPEQGRWELQLKGAGPTPYSRTADGRAVMRSSVREFLCSEAMHHLGVPTTRALSLVATGEQVMRDMFYDGRPRDEPGAVVCRVAPTFLRFGNFQILAAQGEEALLQRLLDYLLMHHHPQLGAPSAAVYARWFDDVCSRTAVMVAHWMRVGFVHGVMNTDNMSILGLTIDYGPYGWLEDYDPAWTPNTTDADRRRYCFGNQPPVALWNLQRLAEALLPLFTSLGIAEAIDAGLALFRTMFEATHRRMLAAKLGFRALVDASDVALANDLAGLLGAVETDMTIFFRRLGVVAAAEGEQGASALLAPLEEAFFLPATVDEAHRQRLAAWLQRYRQRLQEDPLPRAERLQLMRLTNPKYVLRNYLAQEAIEAIEERGDTAPLDRLAAVLRRPYEDQPDQELYAAKRPEWARHKAGCSALSCSS